MSFVLPKPKSITADEVVLKRADWEEVVATVEELIEDAEDVAAVAAERVAEAKVAAQLETERGETSEMTVPMAVMAAELGGTHPLRAWRDHRGWTLSELAERSGIARDVIEQLEIRRQTGSTETLKRLARALGVPADRLNENDEE